MLKPITSFLLVLFAVGIMINPAFAEVINKAMDKDEAKEDTALESESPSNFGWFEPSRASDPKGEIHLRDGSIIKFSDLSAPNVSMLGNIVGNLRMIRLRKNGRNKSHPLKEIIFLEEKDYNFAYTDSFGRHIPANPGTIKAIKKNGTEFLIKNARLEAHGGGISGKIKYKLYNPANEDYQEESQQITNVKKIVFYN